MELEEDLSNDEKVTAVVERGSLRFVYKYCSCPKGFNALSLFLFGSLWLISPVCNRTWNPKSLGYFGIRENFGFDFVRFETRVAKNVEPSSESMACCRTISEILKFEFWIRFGSGEHGIPRSLSFGFRISVVLPRRQRSAIALDFSSLEF